MSLEYRHGHWSIIYWPNGRHARKVRVAIPAAIQDRGEAERQHAQFMENLAEIRSSQVNPRPLTGLSVSKLWEEYLQWYKLHRAPTTYKDIVNVGQWVKKYLGKFSAEDLNSQHITVYQRMRTSEAGKPINRALNKEATYLSGFVKWAGREGHIAPRKLLIDPLPYKRPLPRVLTPEEVIGILDASTPFYRTYFLCLYALGLRSIEAKSLTWKDIDWGRETLTVVQKGGRMKSLPMGAALLSALKGIVQAGANLEAIKNEPIFKSRWNRRKNRPIHDVRGAIARACKKAGVTKRVTPHIFRHSCATHMVDQNVNLRIIQKFLGHSQITTTEIYTHVSLENLRAAQKSISGGL